MAGRKSYEHQLRAIGQSLEAQRINIFELQHDEGQFVVKGEPDKERSLLALLREWQKKIRSEGLNSSLSFGRQDIESLDRQGRAKRLKSGRLPDLYDLSNTLRTLGSYLDTQGAELLEIRKQILSVSLLYRNKDGHPNLEERTIASYHDYLVDLRRKRGERGRASR